MHELITTIPGLPVTSMGKKCPTLAMVCAFCALTGDYRDLHQWSRAVHAAAWRDSANASLCETSVQTGDSCCNSCVEGCQSVARVHDIPRDRGELWTQLQAERLRVLSVLELCQCV